MVLLMFGAVIPEDVDRELHLHRGIKPIRRRRNRHAARVEVDELNVNAATACRA